MNRGTCSRLLVLVLVFINQLEDDMAAITASIDRSAFLRRVLVVDAATCVAMGLLLSLGSDLLSPLLGLPRLLLQYSGLSLFPIAAFMAWVATQANLSRLGAWIVIAGNALWVVGSVILLISDWVFPTSLGHAFVIAQALAVMLLAELEYTGLRRSFA
jgi:hypothetical protein